MLVAEKIVAERLVFVDECGTHTSLALLYGYTPRGERLRFSVPRKRGKNTTLLSSMSSEGMGPEVSSRVVDWIFQSRGVLLLASFY